MLMNRSASSVPSAPKRLRPTGPSCRGGASSLLRLTQPASGRLPTTPDLTEWMTHAASVLMPVTGPLAFMVSGDAR
jgi:hypothetical protein